MSAKVVPFPSAKHPLSPLKENPVLGWREIRAIRGLDSGAKLFACRVSDNALIGDGILDGDYAICREVSNLSEIKPGCIAVVETPAGLLLKHVYAGINEVGLVSANPEYEELCYKLDEVQIVGVLVRIERDF